MSLHVKGCHECKTYHDSAVLIDEVFIFVKDFVLDLFNTLLQMLLDLALIIRLAGDLKPVTLLIEKKLGLRLCFRQFRVASEMRYR
jgi:hypothetical protein